DHVDHRPRLSASILSLGCPPRLSLVAGSRHGGDRGAERCRQGVALGSGRCSPAVPPWLARPCAEVSPTFESPLTVPVFRRVGSTGWFVSAWSSSGPSPVPPPEAPSPGIGA